MTREREKYWYKTTIYECPVCGNGERIRERVHDEKEKGVHYKQQYDQCIERDSLYG